MTNPKFRCALAILAAADVGRLAATADERYGSESRQIDHLRGQLENGEFLRIAEVDRSCNAVRGFHQPDETLDQIVDITKRTGLRSVPVDRNVACRGGPER